MTAWKPWKPASAQKRESGGNGVAAVETASSKLAASAENWRVAAAWWYGYWRDQAVVTMAWLVRSGGGGRASVLAVASAESARWW